MSKEKTDKNQLKDQNDLLKPIAVKQNIIPKTPNQNISIIFPKTNYINNPKEIQNEKGAFSLLMNYNNQNNNNINYIRKDSKIQCTCKKTKCIKKYCECYSSGLLCYNCKCENCENKPLHMNNNIMNNNINKKEEKVEIELNENEENKKLIICTCSKSGCNKNYCECFKAKVKCNNKCRCIKCLNKEDENDDIKEKDKENDNNKIINKSKSAPINVINTVNKEKNKEGNGNIVNNFTVHRISVVISKVQTLINTEKLDLTDTYKFLNKKRNIK